MSGGDIKAVGFDLDGTFMRTHVDYAKLNECDRRVCLEHNIPFDDIDFGKYVKRPRYPIRGWLDAHGRGDEFPSVDKEIDDRCTECECEFVDEARPYPGSAECLKILKDRGFKVGLLTRGSLEYATKALGPLFPEFDVVMGRDHTCYDDAKPSPKAMTDFAKELGVEPEEILYIGDNITDWQSASKAGAKFAGVLTGSGSKEIWADCGDIPVLGFAGDVVDIL